MGLTDTEEVLSNDADDLGEKDVSEYTLMDAFRDSELIFNDHRGRQTDFAEERRRNTGRTYGTKHDAVDASKEAIKAFIQGDEVSFGYALNDIDEAINELNERREKLSRDFFLEVRFQIEQELVEAKFLRVILNEVLEGVVPSKLPLRQEMDALPESYLFGIADSLTEAGKSMKEVFYEAGPSMSVDKRLELLRRFIQVTEKYYSDLQYWEHNPAYLIPNYGDRRRNFRNNFSSKLYRVKNMVLRKKDEVVELESMQALFAQHFYPNGRS